MSHYRLTTQAQQDLIQIRRFTVANWGLKQSSNYLKDISERLQLLSEMPSLGKKCVDLGKDLYRFLFGSHVIYYQSIPEAVVVIAILHQSMVPESYLEGRGQ